MLLLLTINAQNIQCLLIFVLPEVIILSAENSHAEPRYRSKTEKKRYKYILQNEMGIKHKTLYEL